MSDWIGLDKVLYFWGTMAFILGGMCCGIGVFLWKVLAS